MGFQMALHLRRNIPSSTPLTIFDFDSQAMDRYLTESPDLCGPIHIAQNPREVAEAECIITVLSTEADVKKMYLTSETGLLSGSIVGKIFIDSSNVDRGIFAEIEQCMTTSDPDTPPVFYYASVSGGTSAAKEGKIEFTIDMAADSPRLPVFKEILTCMGNSIRTRDDEELLR